MTIKLHLDDAEVAPIARLADVLQVKPEDVVYAAVNRLMMHAREPETQKEIVQLRDARVNNLPLWADSAGSAHNYEGMSPCEPEKSKYSV